jgi:flagellar hook-associated protein 2
MAGSSIDGLISGLDTTTIISQLMTIERQPQDQLKSKQNDANTTLSVYRALNTKFNSLATAASSLSRVADWRLMKATSSSGAAVASATSGAQVGALSFTVQYLSRAGTIASTGTVGSTSNVVAGGPVLVAKGAGVLGFSGLSAGAGLTVGPHTLEVTQATAGAVQTATAALAGATTFAADSTLDVTVNGAARTYTIAAGSYSPAQLAAALQTASGGDLTAAVGSDGKLSITTTLEGSTASLAVIGGTAAADLFLAAGGPAAAGTDGAVSVDGGAAITVSAAGPGLTRSLAGANGTIEAAFAGGLRLGKSTLANVDPGNGSLAALVDAVNASGSGISAAAVKVGAAAYRLQLASTTTGAASDISVDPQHLVGGMASFSTVQSGRDALIQIGDGDGAYTVSSATDSLTDVLPGVTFSLKAADPNAVITVTVAQDGEALADRVSKMVDAANAAVAFIADQSSYDPETKTAGLLLSDGMTRTLQQQVYAAISDAVPGATLGSPGSAGISLNKDGSISFDRAKFTAAYAKNPDAVASLFRAGGTATDSHVSFLTASAKTKAGAYAVTVTTPAAQAEADGSALSGAGLVADETIDVRSGAVSLSYAAHAGATLDSVAAGLNAAFAEKGMALSAQVVSGRLVVRTSGYGAGATFDIRSSALGAAGAQTGLVSASGQWETHTGTNVAGTINGVAATGNGQVLISPATDQTLGGLALTVTATAAGAYGTFTYVPGAAQRLNMVASGAVAFGSGSITTAISGKQSQIKDLGTQISNWDDRLAAREALLKTQYANLETALGKLKDQSSWLAGQLASLPTTK